MIRPRDRDLPHLGAGPWARLCAFATSPQNSPVRAVLRAQGGLTTPIRKYTVFRPAAGPSDRPCRPPSLGAPREQAHERPPTSTPFGVGTKLFERARGPETRCPPARAADRPTHRPARDVTCAMCPQLEQNCTGGAPPPRSAAPMPLPPTARRQSGAGRGGAHSQATAHIPLPPWFQPLSINTKFIGKLNWSSSGAWAGRAPCRSGTPAQRGPPRLHQVQGTHLGCNCWHRF